jgi:hypothetical protein
VDRPRRSDERPPDADARPPGGRPPTVAERRFAEEAAALRELDLAQRFARVYETNLWSDAESRSGVGSSLAATARLRAELPPLLRRLGARRLLDVPCGDFHWMSQVDLAGIEYVGGDIVPALVDEVRRRHARADRRFVVVDLTTGPLPAADVVLCRDALVHLSVANVRRALAAIRASGATWLITTTFPGRGPAPDVADGDWRPLDLQAPPFSLPAPVELLVEGCEEEGGAYADKSLGVWRVAELPAD